MLNTLLKLFENDNLMSRFENALDILNNKIQNEFGKINAQAIFSAGFKDMGCNYELKLNLHEGVTENDINIEMENDETVKISCTQELENSTFKAITVTTLPEDAIADTLTAELVDSTVVVKVEKAKTAKKIEISKK